MVAATHWTFSWGKMVCLGLVYQDGQWDLQPHLCAWWWRCNQEPVFVTHRKPKSLHVFFKPLSCNWQVKLPLASNTLVRGKYIVACFLLLWMVRNSGSMLPRFSFFIGRNTLAFWGFSVQPYSTDPEIRFIYVLFCNVCKWSTMLYLQKTLSCRSHVICFKLIYNILISILI